MTVSTAEDKAAIVLLSLAPEAAETVLARLDPAQSGKLRSRMEALRQDSEIDETAESVLREFGELIQVAANAGPAAALHTTTTTGSQHREFEQEQIDPETVQGDAVAALCSLGVDRLAAALQGEQVRTIVIVLNCLENERAGEVLKRLQPETRKVVSLQLGQPVSGGMEVLERIASAVVKKALAIEDSPAKADEEAKFKKIADMLRSLDKPERLEILGLLEENDAVTAARVKEFLYQFEDLLLIEDRSMQKVLSEIDSKNLAVALKGATEEIKEKVLGNLSKRARDTLQEEMEFLGSTPSSQVRQAQKMVVEVIQRLDQAGELVMKEE